jgi:hypothetical protein
MGKFRTKLDGLGPSFLSQNSLRILIPETLVSQNVLFRYKPQHLSGPMPLQSPMNSMGYGRQ